MPTGKVAEGFRAQAVQAMENIKTALASVGGGFEHVVKLTSYLTNLEAHGPEFREVRGSYFPNKEALPASTLLQIISARQSGLPGGSRGDRDPSAQGVAKRPIYPRGQTCPRLDRGTLPRRARYHEYGRRLPTADHYPQTSSATSTMSASFAHCSFSARRFPSSVEAKPHCGERQS